MYRYEKLTKNLGNAVFNFISLSIVVKYDLDVLLKTHPSTYDHVQGGYLIFSLFTL